LLVTQFLRLDQELSRANNALASAVAWPLADRAENSSITIILVAPQLGHDRVGVTGASLSANFFGSIDFASGVVPSNSWRHKARFSRRWRFDKIP
jgi:hypothetical protein